MNWVPRSFCVVVLFAASAFAASEPVGPSQILDDMIRQLRKVQSAMQKELQQPSEQWQDDLTKMIEPLLSSTADLYRSSAQTGSPATAYGLRVMVNNLRASRDPKLAVEQAEKLTQTISFLRFEYELSAQKQAPPPAPAITRSRNREIVMEILRRAEFQQSAKPNVFDHYVNRIVVKAMAWIRSLFDSQAMRQAGQFAYGLLWIAYAIVSALIGWLIYRAWSPKRRLAEQKSRAAKMASVPLTPEQHLAEAEAFVKAGDYAAAVRAYFLVLLATLERENFVPRNRSWTNHEYLRAFGQRVTDGRLSTRMTSLTSLCDGISYGGQTCDETRFIQFRNEVDDFVESLPGAHS